MLGAITGDTIGSRFEFAGTKRTDFDLFGPGCRYTDDSVMTMAVAEWLMDDPTHSHEVLEKKMVKYGELDPGAGYGGMFSEWLFYPEALYRDGIRKPYNSFGNGSAMRVSSVGWMFETMEETESGRNLGQHHSQPSRRHQRGASHGCSNFHGTKRSQ